MLGRKNNLVIGLTTFRNEMLRISVSALGKLKQKFLLIIHNDNPATTVSRRQIRKLGYRGPLMIINSLENMGTLRARLAIISAVAKLKHVPEWIIFNDDDDLLINLDVPRANSDIFAIIQNMIVLRRRVVDLFRVMDKPTEYIVDDDNIVLDKPHIGFAGTLIKTDLLIKLATIWTGVIDKIQQIDDGLDYRPPVDAMMWSGVNIFARHINPNAMPIYMDRVNYIATNIDTAIIKYGRPDCPTCNVGEHYARAISRYDAVLRAALNANDAPVGAN